MRVLLLLLFAISVAPLTATSQTVDLGGLVYSDYSYTVSSPDSEEEGENGFGYRRVYLTANAKISEKFSGRVRFEANDGSTTAQGRPAPFVKDLYIKWKDAFAEGHAITIGVSSPPSFTVAEKSWGFRSLQKTILDKNKIVSSRDMGIAVHGPLTSSGSVKYGVMVANNESVKGESDKNKRIYAQLEFHPGDALVATIGSDFAPYSGSVDQVLNINAFVGVKTESVTAGIEGFRSNTSFTGEGSDVAETGASLFARAPVSKKVEVVGRVDYVTNDFNELSETFFVAGIAVKPDPNVRIIPNILMSKMEDEDGMITARVTLHADF